MYEVPDLTVLAKETTLRGYGILYPMQLGWVRSDTSKEFYRGRVYSDEILMMTVPGSDWDQIKGGDFSESTMDEKIVGGIHNARQHYRDQVKEGNTKRMWKTYLLRFPAGHKLSSKEIYSEAGEDQDLEVDFVKVYLSKKKSSFRYYACWSVVNKEKKKFARGAIDDEQQMSRNAAKLEALGLLDNSDEENIDGSGNPK